jgi:hypothetical protein
VQLVWVQRVQLAQPVWAPRLVYQVQQVQQVHWVQRVHWVRPVQQARSVRRGRLALAVSFRQPYLFVIRLSFFVIQAPSAHRLPPV